MKRLKKPKPKQLERQNNVYNIKYIVVNDVNYFRFLWISNGHFLLAI